MQFSIVTYKKILYDKKYNMKNKVCIYVEMIDKLKDKSLNKWL